MLNFEKYFDTTNSLWQKVLKILDDNKDLPKIVVKNRNLHHIIPRSFFKKDSLPVDNSNENLISLSYSEHFLIHYYYWKCANKGYRSSMARAVRYMSKTLIGSISEETAELLADDYARLQEDAYIISDETRKKLSEFRKTYTGWHHSDKTKAKLREARKNFHPSKDQIKKTAESYKKYWKSLSKEEKERINKKKGGDHKGKTYEEIYGYELAQVLKEKRRLQLKNKPRPQYWRKKSAFTKILCVELNKTFIGYAEAAQFIGAKSKSTICNVINNPNRTAGGYHWEKIIEDN